MTKRILTYLLFMLFTLFFHTTISAAQQEPEPTDDTKPIVVEAKKPNFTITIKSNPTTGYRWFIRSYPFDYVVPLKHKFAKPTSNLMGAPTYETFEFKLKPAAFKAPHQFIIRFNYLRPFEMSGRVEGKTFRVLTNGAT